PQIRTRLAGRGRGRRSSRAHSWFPSSPRLGFRPFTAGLAASAGGPTKIMPRRLRLFQNHPKPYHFTKPRHCVGADRHGEPEGHQQRATTSPPDAWLRSITPRGIPSDLAAMKPRGSGPVASAGRIAVRGVFSSWNVTEITTFWLHVAVAS